MKTKLLILSAFLASLANAQFAPVPTLQNKPWRIFAGATESLSFNAFRHTQAELKTSLVHQISPGFDAGVALHGGFGSSPSYPGVLGIDLMGRYLEDWNSPLFGGFQVVAGYTYNGLGLSNRSIEVASTIPITMGPVFGVIASKDVRIYWFPALELGRKDYSKETTFWGNQIGCQAGLGTAIKLGGPLVLSLEIRPRMSWNLEPASRQFSIDTTAALVWNL